MENQAAYTAAKRAPPAFSSGRYAGCAQLSWLRGASGQPRTWTTISRAAVNALHHHLSESRTPLPVPKSYPSHHLLSTGTRQHWRAVRWEAAALRLAILEPSHSLPVMEHPPSGRHLMSARLDTRTEAHVQVVETLSKLNLDLLRHALTIPPHASAPPGISQTMNSSI